MALTVSSNVFECKREQAKFIAECANLRHEVTSVPHDRNGMFPSFTGDVWDMWQDRATGGGGCRIVWAAGIAWISRHSGYAYADITEDVKELFAELGCKPLGDEHLEHYNPQIYGTKYWERDEHWNMYIPR